MNIEKRIKKIEDSLNEYMENIDDQFQSLDLSIELIQNHMEWLLNQVKLSQDKEIFILHIEDMDNVESYHYAFKTQEDAWDFAVQDAEEISGLTEEELLENGEKYSWFQVDAKCRFYYSIISTVIE